MTAMDDTITVLRVPTGLPVPDAMQEAQDRLLARFGDTPPQVAVNLQAVVDNPDAILLFAIAGKEPKTPEDWQGIKVHISMT